MGQLAYVYLLLVPTAGYSQVLLIAWTLAKARRAIPSRPSLRVKIGLLHWSLWSDLTGRSPPRNAKGLPEQL